MDSGGVKSTIKIPNIPEDENCLFQQALQSLRKDIQRAELYIRNHLPSAKSM